MNSLNNELAGFTGTESYYYSDIFPGCYITDGVKYAADTYGLYWFLDIICSYQGEKKFKCELFQVWTLKEPEIAHLSLSQMMAIKTSSKVKEYNFLIL